jgi:hypothetical protein
MMVQDIYYKISALSGMTTLIFYLYACNQGYFCDGTHRIAVPAALSQKDASRNGVPEPFFFRAIDITRLGVSCYPTSLLSNKLAQRPLKFQWVTANNSLDFVQFLKKKNPPPRTECWVTLCVAEPIFFVEK